MKQPADEAFLLEAQGLRGKRSVDPRSCPLTRLSIEELDRIAEERFRQSEIDGTGNEGVRIPLGDHHGR